MAGKNYSGTNNDDDYVGSDYNETISGGKGDDELRGKAGNDVIMGGAGENLLYADDGNDKVIATGTDDTVYGGGGNDTISASGGLAADIDAGDGTDSVNASARNALSIRLGEGNDVVKAIANIDLNAKKTGVTHESTVNVYGDDGKDTITASAVSVTARGGDGDDKLDLTGYNYVDASGGDGNDIFIFRSVSQGLDIYANGNDGNDSFTASGQLGAVSVRGGDGNDSFVFTAQSATVSGDDGADIITLKGTALNVSGGSGNDRITVTSIFGSTIDGGADRDTIALASSGGSDFLLYTSRSGADSISGFNVTRDAIGITSSLVKGNVAAYMREVLATAKYSGTEADLNLGSGVTIHFTGLNGHFDSNDLVYLG